MNSLGAETPNLNSAILQCIDAGLESIGSTSKKVIYWYLSQKKNVRKENIPEHPAALIEALKDMFGQGAGIMERTIVRELKQRFNITLGEDLGEVLSLVKRSSRPLP